MLVEPVLLNPAAPVPAAPDQHVVSLIEENRRFHALVVELLYKNAQLREALRGKGETDDRLTG